MRTALITFGLILIVLTLRLSLYNAIEFKLTNVDCTSFNKSLFLIYECELVTGKNNRNIFNFNGTLIQPANKFDINYQFLKKAKGYKPWLYNFTIDGCRFLKKAYNPVAILISNMFMEFTNFNHTCPLMGPQLIKGFYLRWNVLPHPIPTGEYQLASRIFISKKQQIAINTFFEFVED